jgi:hypothetical protein
MKVGITLPQYGPHTTKENIIHLAMMAEQEQLDSVWVFERLLWPIHPQTPYPGSADGNLSPALQNVFDPMETLTFVAAKTEKSIKEMGVNHVIFGLMGPDLDRVIDTANQLSRFIR